MASLLVDGFKYVYSLNQRKMTFCRPGGIEVDIFVLPSNYTKNSNLPEEIVVEGRQFVISKDQLSKTVEKVPKRGDQLTDPDLGVNTIEQIEPLIIMGEVVGYRVNLK